jgi:hypothetical protein
MSVGFAVGAAVMKRLLCLWAPYMCILAGAGISDRRLWAGLFDVEAIKTRCSWAGDVARLSVYGLVAACLFYKFDLKFGAELGDLREFHDPDTVNLLNWITASTPTTAVFAGNNV